MTLDNRIKNNKSTQYKILENDVKNLHIKLQILNDEN